MRVKNVAAPPSSAAGHPRPGLFRRLAAIVYDSLLLFTVLFFATALAILVNGGHAIRPPNPFLTSYLFIVSFFFFAGFWIHGGQTLGMRAWRIRVQRYDGLPITWWQALLRFLTAIVSWLALGAGFWWILIDGKKLAWHDRYSETELVNVPRQ